MCVGYFDIGSFYHGLAFKWIHLQSLGIIVSLLTSVILQCWLLMAVLNRQSYWIIGWVEGYGVFFLAFYFINYVTFQECNLSLPIQKSSKIIHTCFSILRTTMHWVSFIFMWFYVQCISAHFLLGYVHIFSTYEQSTVNFPGGRRRCKAPCGVAQFHQSLPGTTTAASQ